MENYSQKGLIKAVKENRIYDYIANHYTEMPKEDLKEVLLVLLDTLYEDCRGDEDEKALMELIEDVLDNRDFGDNE